LSSMERRPAIAGAVVVDVGGTMSHGAIVARELGVPRIVPWAQGEKCLRLFAEKVLPIAQTFEPAAEVVA
jgi:phosphoenolpyruvate-protein kinase (PTS system EI component)